MLYQLSYAGVPFILASGLALCAPCGRWPIQPAPSRGRRTVDYPPSSALQLEQFPQPPRLYPAYRDFGVLFIVHAELIARLEPGHHFLDAVDVHQIGAMHAPEHLAVQVCLEILNRPVVDRKSTRLNSS